MTPCGIKNWDKQQWDRLLSYIDAGLVIPILGNEISRFGAGEALPLARRVAKRLRLPIRNLSPEAPLNDLALRQLEARGSTQDVYLELFESLESDPIEPSDSQKRLAEIAGFQLFLTTGFDSSLEIALHEARGVEPRSLAYAANNVQDIELAPKGRTQTIVYHLLVKAGVGPNYAVTEEDALEFFHAVLTKRPKKLFMELLAKHLLIVGGGYGDWLARLFLRASKGQRLSMPRPVSETIACQKTAGDQRLLQFLTQFSTPTRFFAEVDPVGFVTELHRRWSQRHKRRATIQPSGRAPDQEKLSLPRTIPANAVFLSYASEDRKVARNLHLGLSRHGIKSWFDTEQLEPGQEFATMIRRNINACALFLPIISRKTAASGERFFKREWTWAVKRAEGYLRTDPPLIIPVVVDDTEEDAHWVPDEFLRRHWARLRDGQVTTKFVASVRRLLAAGPRSNRTLTR